MRQGPIVTAGRLLPGLLCLGKITSSFSRCIPFGCQIAQCWVMYYKLGNNTENWNFLGKDSWLTSTDIKNNPSPIFESCHQFSTRIRSLASGTNSSNFYFNLEILSTMDNGHRKSLTKHDLVPQFRTYRFVIQERKRQLLINDYCTHNPAHNDTECRCVSKAEGGMYATDLTCTSNTVYLNPQTHAKNGELILVLFSSYPFTKQPKTNTFRVGK